MLLSDADLDVIAGLPGWNSPAADAARGKIHSTTAKVLDDAAVIGAVQQLAQETAAAVAKLQSELADIRTQQARARRHHRTGRDGCGRRRACETKPRTSSYWRVATTRPWRRLPGSATTRRAVADEMSGHTSAWRAAGRAGFANFIGILEGQADRLRADLEDLADKLRAAADAYENQELESSAALDIVSTL